MTTIISTLNERLAELQLSPHQEQAVRALLIEATTLFDVRKQIEDLERHFGGQEKWRNVARQISAWGIKALPPQVFEALASTTAGVLAMHRLMATEQHSQNQNAWDTALSLSEADLKRMMRDPRYWRDQDPEIVERVREGFRRLYNKECR